MSMIAGRPLPNPEISVHLSCYGFAQQTILLNAIFVVNVIWCILQFYMIPHCFIFQNFCGHTQCTTKAMAIDDIPSAAFDARTGSYVSEGDELY